MIEVYHGIDEIDLVTFKRLKFLTNGGWGRHDSAMHYLMCDDGYKDHINIIVIKKVNGVIVGWGMVFRCPMWDKLEMHVYVHHTCRRKGYGREIATRAIQEAESLDNGSVFVYPWDQIGVDFYKGVGIGPSQLR